MLSSNVAAVSSVALGIICITAIVLFIAFLSKRKDGEPFELRMPFLVLKTGRQDEDKGGERGKSKDKRTAARQRRKLARRKRPTAQESRPTEESDTSEPPDSGV